jgi:hypothetical protein
VAALVFMQENQWPKQGQGGNWDSRITVSLLLQDCQRLCKAMLFCLSSKQDQAHGFQKKRQCGLDGRLKAAKVMPAFAPVTG